MTNLTDLTGIQLLDWLVEANATPKYVRSLTQLGVTDLDTLRAAAKVRESTLIAISHVADARAGQPPMFAPADATILVHIDTVGTRVFVDDSARLGEWLRVAALYEKHRPAFVSHKGPDGAHRQRHIPWEIDAFIDADRTPEYATAMIEAAVATGSAPDVHGYDGGMTPELFRRLINAGIPNRAALTTFYDAGLTGADAFQLAAEGISPRVARAAAEDGLPRTRWSELLPAIPERWVPEAGIAEPRTDTANAMLSVPGITWEIMHELATTGWSGLSPWDLRNRRYGYKNDLCSEWTLDEVLRAARLGLSEADIHSWVKVLHTGKGGTEWWERALPSITGRYTASLPRTIDAILTLREHGIRPSWIGDYRALGARSIGDAVTLATAGVTAARAKQVLATHGQRKYAHDPLRIRSLSASLAALTADSGRAADTDT